MDLCKEFVRLGLLLGLGAAAAPAYAGDPNARDWIPAPVGTNLVVGYFGALYSNGVYAGGDRIDGVSADANYFVYRQMHYRDIGGYTAQLEFIVPVNRTTIDLPGEDSQRLAGIGDVTLGSAFWLYNNNETKTWFAVEPFVTLPVGRYDGNRPDVSAGKNRWSFLADAAFVKGFGQSSFLELIGEGEFYGDNDDWYGQTLKKDPSLRLFAIASTNVSENVYVGLRYRYETGGREKVAGDTATSRADNHQLAFETTYQINEGNQVQAQYIHDLRVENGPRMHGVQLRYAHAF